MYRVEIDNKGGYAFNVKSKDYEFIKNCPVHNTLKYGPAVQIKISQ